MNPPRRLRGTFGMCNLREGFVNLREGFVVAPWRLREAFSKTRSAKASRSPLEGFAKAPRAPSFGNDSSDNDKPPTKTHRMDGTVKKYLRICCKTIMYHSLLVIIL